MPERRLCRHLIGPPVPDNQRNNQTCPFCQVVCEIPTDGACLTQPRRAVNESAGPLLVEPVTNLADHLMHGRRVHGVLARQDAVLGIDLRWQHVNLLVAARRRGGRPGALRLGCVIGSELARSSVPPGVSLTLGMALGGVPGARVASSSFACACLSSDSP